MKPLIKIVNGFKYYKVRDFMAHKKSRQLDTQMLEFEEAEMLFESEHRCSIKGKKKSKYFPDDKKHNINFVPKTKNQELALEYFKTKPIVVCTGSAGVGKCLCGKTVLEIYVDDDMYDLLTKE